MASHVTLTLRLSELCEQIAVERQDVEALVAHGILVPVDPRAGEWDFDTRAIPRLTRALRLRQDLELNWPGVALALELLDELEQVRRENRRLLQRLQRFELP